MAIANAEPVKATEPTYSFVIRTCDKDLRSYDGFQWPASGMVECPDWNPEPKCGNGLHGLRWGEGNWNYLSKEHYAKWLIVKVDDRDLVDIDLDKVKFKRGEVVFCGGMAEAITRLLCSLEEFDRLKAKSKGKEVVSGNYSKAASSGNSSTAASSGNYSKAASSGNYSTAASSGDFSTAASSGDFSTAASSGNYSKAEAIGQNTIACVVGLNGAAKAGIGGVFTLHFKDSAGRIRTISRYPGEDGIEPDAWYRVKDGQLVKC